MVLILTSADEKQSYFSSRLTAGDTDGDLHILKPLDGCDPLLCTILLFVVVVVSILHSLFSPLSDVPVVNACRRHLQCLVTNQNHVTQGNKSTTHHGRTYTHTVICSRKKSKSSSQSCIFCFAPPSFSLRSSFASSIGYDSITFACRTHVRQPRFLLTSAVISSGHVRLATDIPLPSAALTLLRIMCR